MSPYRLRPATIADAPAIVALYVAAWNAGFAGYLPPISVTSARIARWESDLGSLRHRWWVAEEDGALVGLVGIGPSRDPPDGALGELDTISVAPNRWRAGIGRALMGVALSGLAAAGYREAILWTLADYPPAQRFYEATGWRSDGATRADGSQVRYRRAV